MIAKSLEVRACKIDRSIAPASALRGIKRDKGTEFLVYSLTTESGDTASMFGFAGASAEGSAKLASAYIAPFVQGRNILEREALWQEFRKQDRMWGHLPIYSYGPLDVCLWLLAAQAAEQPLFRYIGACRNQIGVYLSSMFLTDSASYVEEALTAKSMGFAGYKLHPPGNSLEEDLTIHSDVREAVGSGFTLMSDPVAFMSLPEAIKYGRFLESLNYQWIEEPMPDENIHALQELTRQLDIQVVGTEVLAKHPYSIADCIARRVVDTVRADVSWSGGITAVLKTAHLAEAFNVNCEIHTTIFHPLEMVNMHLCGAIKNCSYLELLCPVDTFDFGLVEKLPITGGVATLPESPGLGVDLDWDLIDNATISKF